MTDVQPDEDESTVEASADAVQVQAVESDDVQAIVSDDPVQAVAESKSVEIQFPHPVETMEVDWNDLDLLSKNLIRDSEDRITGIELEYQNGDVDYTVSYDEPGNAAIVQFDRTVATLSSPLDPETHEMDFTRDSQGRITQYVITYAKKEVVFDITWSGETTVGTFTRTENQL